jgi:hypothetical protein
MDESRRIRDSSDTESIRSDYSSLVLEATYRQLARYPESTLADIYKSFFQDEFGPGHLLEDPVAAREYFDRELSTMESRRRHTAEPCGVGRRFVRVSLDVVVDGLIDADRYFAAFLSGARSFRLPEIAQWADTWSGIVHDLELLRVRIARFDEDVSTIGDALQSGTYVMHHSRDYVLRYDPHYRLLSVAEYDSIEALGR